MLRSWTVSGVGTETEKIKKTSVEHRSAKLHNNEVSLCSLSLNETLDINGARALCRVIVTNTVLWKLDLFVGL